MIASSQGGVNIEKVAEDNPEAILYMPIDITKGNHLLLNSSVDIVFFFNINLLLLQNESLNIIYLKIEK